MAKAKITPAQRAQVRKCAACGLAWDDIAAIVDIPKSTLQRLAGDSYRQGAAKAHARVGKMIYNQAVGLVPARDKDGLPLKAKVGDRRVTVYDRPNLIAAIFYAKTRMGWKEGLDVTRMDADPSGGAEAAARLEAALDRLAVTTQPTPPAVPAPDQPATSAAG